MQPDDSKPYYILGIIYKSLGNYELAKENFKKSIEIEPDFVDAFDALNEISIEQNKGDDGINYGDIAINKMQE